MKFKNILLILSLAAVLWSCEKDDESNEFGLRVVMISEVITEPEYDQIVWIRNNTVHTVNIEGWTIGTLEFPVIYKYGSPISSESTRGIYRNEFKGNAKFKKSGEEVFLKNAEGEIVHSIHY